MSIYVTGDIHGYPIRLTDENLKARGLDLTNQDKLIICGDFGLPWYNDAQELQCIEWLSQRPFEILFVDGNHENFDLLNAFPITEKYAGKVHQIESNIYHLMRGEVYEIEGKKIFTFGGASSFDKYMREEHVDWWKDEILNEEETLNAMRNLSAIGNKVDYVIAHTAPSKFLSNVEVHQQGVDVCPVAKFLDDLSCKIKWNKWCFGHFHTDIKISDDVECVYENIERL